MKYRYAYQRGSAPLLSWKGGPPRQTRAADATALGLGSLAEPTIALPLPRPGSPEPVGDCGCSDTVVIDITSPSFVVGALVGALFLSRLFKSGGG
jgi:hypothetical protein